MEPLAIVVLAVAMAIASVQISVRSVQRLMIGEDGEAPIEADIVADSVMGAAVVIKLVLYFMCKRYADISPAADALAQARLRHLPLLN
jgi:hypothetical protein